MSDFSSTQAASSRASSGVAGAAPLPAAQGSAKWQSDTRQWHELTKARDQIAVALYPTVVRGVIEGRIEGPTKADGSKINPHFRAAIHARNFADALLRALADQEVRPSDNGGEL